MEEGDFFLLLALGVENSTRRDDGVCRRRLVCLFVSIGPKKKDPEKIRDTT